MCYLLPLPTEIRLVILEDLLIAPLIAPDSQVISCSPTVFPERSEGLVS